MKLKRLPHCLSLTADPDGIEVPHEIQVLDPTGGPVARYVFASDFTGCRRDAPVIAGTPSEPLAVDELPATIVVEEGPLPERLRFEIHSPEPCRRHGWDCPLWVREAVFSRSKERSSKN